MSLSISDADVLRFEFDALCVIAAQVIDEHVNDLGVCRSCGSEFPCRRACLAEHNLEVFGCEPHTHGSDHEPGKEGGDDLVRPGSVPYGAQRRWMI